jgi:hypothetical protein
LSLEIKPIQLDKEETLEQKDSTDYRVLAVNDKFHNKMISKKKKWSMVIGENQRKKVSLCC